jgi:hypothetical protein
MSASNPHEYRGGLTDPMRLFSGWASPLQRACLVLVVAASALVGGWAAGTGHGPLIVLAIFAGALIAALIRWPGIGAYCVVLSVAIPYTWSRSAGSSVIAYPLLMALPLACASIPRLNTLKLRPGMLDWLVLAIVLDVGLSEALTGLGYSLLQHEVLNILIPFAGVRLFFTAYPQCLKQLPRAFLAVGAIAVAYAVCQEALGSDPAGKLAPLYNPVLVRWTGVLSRGGELRAPSSFSQPIAFGSFLIVPAVFAFAKRRWVMLAIVLIGIGLTFSRGPYIAVIVSLVLIAVLRGRLTRVGIVLALIVLAASQIGPVSHVISNSFTAGTLENQNANYRTKLLSTSLQNLSLVGTPIPQNETGNLLLGQGLPDLTSYLAVTVVRTGAIGLLLWLALVGYLGRLFLLARSLKDETLGMMTVAMIGLWFSLLSVSLITNFQYVVWILLGGLAAHVAANCRFAERAPATAGHGCLPAIPGLEHASAKPGPKLAPGIPGGLVA